MPRFTESVQAKVDAAHSDVALAMEEAQALFGVQPDARIAMPLKAESEIFFYTKSRLLSPTQCEKILKGHTDYTLDLRPLIPKIEKVFSFSPQRWESVRLSQTDPEQEQVNSYNCMYVGAPQGWLWNKDRHLSAIVWLEDSEEDVLLFPYLKITKDSEPKRIKARAGKLLVFPSNPLYAFKALGSVKFLETHATRDGIQKPPATH